MNKIRISVAVLFLLLTAFAWKHQFDVHTAQENNYLLLCEKAQGYADNKLYQKAAETYAQALAIKEAADIRAAQISVYRDGYQAGVLTAKNFTKTLNEAIAVYPKEAPYWEMLIRTQLNSNAYADAYKSCQKAARAGAKSETLDALTQEISYSYKNGSKSYSAVFADTDGHFTLYNGEHWGVLNPTGDSWSYECVYRYISPIGTDGRVYLESVGEPDTASSGQIVDKSGRIQSYITFEKAQCKAASERFIPVFRDDGWQYYDFEKGDYVPGVYEEASAVTDSIAAVKEIGSTVWHLKNIVDDTALDGTFTDIKLFDNGEYLYGGKMVASEGTGYGLYRADGKKLAALPGNDADLYCGGKIAFRDDSGLWGYADTKGNIVLEAQFESAKSFSGSLAAVCLDGKWGYINTSGQMVIENQYVSAGYLNKNGVGFVSLSDGEYFPIMLRFPQ